MSRFRTRALCGAVLSVGVAVSPLRANSVAPNRQSISAPAAKGPATGLADAAALRSTVFGTPPTEIASLPATVPLLEINMSMPWARPIPKLFWFDKRLRVWLSAQDKPAPLAIVVAGTGGDGNTAALSVLRGILYGAGYHVLTMPSPTFPGFIVSTSSTGVAGDLRQDGADLYAAMVRIVTHLPHNVQITDLDVLGYSLGGANAAMVKSIDAKEHLLNIHRAVMIEPPVSLFASIARIDKLFALNIGKGDTSIERLYDRLYVQLANFYRATDRVEIDETSLLAAAAAILHSDADFSAAIALTFRLALMDMFFMGDYYAGTGVVIDPRHPPRLGDPLEGVEQSLRTKPFADYFTQVFAPYYLRHRAHSTVQSLIDDNGLGIIGETLQTDRDYYVQTNSDDLVLDRSELAWLTAIMGPRIAVYDHGGHLGNLGERQQAADMLLMLRGDWRGDAQ